MTGVGVNPSSRWMIVCTPLAARTSSAVRWAGPEIGALGMPVVADGLGDGENVGFGERPAERRAAMPAGAKADQLTGIIEVRLALEIFAFELGRIDQHFLWRRLACQGRDGHVRKSLSMTPDTAWRSRSRPRTGRSYDRWRTSRIRPHSISPSAPIRRRP